MVDLREDPGSKGSTPISAQETFLQGVVEGLLDMVRRRDPAALASRSGLVNRPAMAISASAVCPYCAASLGKRKPPRRCSTFTCKTCGQQVYADPKQELFTNVYMTEKQIALVGYLWQLNHWVFTAGTLDDFCWAKAQIGKADKPNTDDVVSDTIWFLLNYNLRNLHKINPNTNATIVGSERQDVIRLIREFREDNRARRELGTSGMKSIEKGTCEGCGNSPRVLTKIESGQCVCRTCLREIRG